MYLKEKEIISFVLNKIPDQNCKALLQSSTETKTSEGAKVLACKVFKPSVSNGAYYKFKLLAYPTRRSSESRKLIEIKDTNEQVEWLQRKTDRRHCYCDLNGQLSDYLLK